MQARPQSDCDVGCTADLETVNCFLQHAVSIGDSFVLAQMFEPGFHQKRLNHPAFVGSVLEHAPGVSAIAPAWLTYDFLFGLNLHLSAALFGARIGYESEWLIHCHIPHHTTNNNVEVQGAGGLTMIIDVED